MVLALALLVASMVSLFAVSLPTEQQFRVDQSLFVAEAVNALPTNWAAAQAVPGAAPRTLPHDWRQSAPHTERAWYFLSFTTESIIDETLSLWVPRVAMNAQVYLNGRLLATRGRLSPSVSRNWNRPWLIPISVTQLRSGENLLALEVAAERAGQGLLRELYVGPDSVLRDYHQSNAFFSDTLLQIIVVMMLLVSAFMALLWWWGRRDPVYGSYSLMLFSWAVHDIYPLVTSGLIAPLLLDWFWHVSLVWFVYTVQVFVFRYLRREEPELERRFLYWALGSTFGLSLFALFWPSVFYDHGIIISDTVTLVAASYPLLCVVQNLGRRPSTDMALMILAGALALIFGFHDWLLMTGGWSRTTNYLMPYGSPAIMLVFGLLLTRRFGEALSSLEMMNQSLEQQVKDREQEIALSHQRLLKLETERAIVNERERMVRDMHDGLGGTLVSTLAMVKSGSVSTNSIEAALQGAIEDMRLMVDSLDPVEGDLVSVLANLRSRLAPRLRAAGLKVQWKVTDLPSITWLSPQGVLNVMRILQEAINNVLKHAHAQTIEVACGFDSEAGAVWVCLRDDGIGMQASESHDDQCQFVRAVSGGRGLGNMKQRAESIGATLQIGPRQGGGTTVLLTLPVCAPVPEQVGR